MSSYPTKTQVSAGGVPYREVDGRLQIVLISVGEAGRWQLPKGTPSKGESKEQTALREVREETGLTTELVEPLDKIEYWFYVQGKTRRVRVHKFVYFFLLRYLSGDTQDHDHEVNEARWVDIHEAEVMLAFESEKQVVAKAKQILSGENGG